MYKQDIKKEITRELKQIEREYDVANWDYTDVDRMLPDEAYNRGYYRAYSSILSMLTE